MYLVKDSQQKARKEVLNILGTDPVDVLPDINQLKQMDYLSNVIKEVSHLEDELLSEENFHSE